MRLDAVVLEAFGTPDIRQIDGLGGADPLTMTRRRFRALKAQSFMKSTAIHNRATRRLFESDIPLGTLQVEIEGQNGQLERTKAALARTARLLMNGKVYVR